MTDPLRWQVKRLERRLDRVAVEPRPKVPRYALNDGPALDLDDWATDTLDFVIEAAEDGRVECVQERRRRGRDVVRVLVTEPPFRQLPPGPLLLPGPTGNTYGYQ